MLKALITTFFLILLPLYANADSAESERDKVNKTRTEILRKFYQQDAAIREEVRRASGYATFSNIGVNLAFFSAAGGNGVAHNNRTGKDTYMNMASAGLGLGLGIKDFRALFVFHTPKAYQQFIEHGWDFSGQADAAAKSTQRGDEGSAAVTALPGVSIYQLTEAGIALQATLQGTKYWKSKKLNNR